MKIGVIAGSVVDTQMGVDLLTSFGFDTMFLPMSKDCIEQAKMQYFSKEELQELFENTCKQAVVDGAKKIMIYCNSLSACVDYKKASKDLNIDIITPLESYIHIPENVKNIAILSANGISAYTVDKIIQEHNENINTITIGNLSIVEEIESKKSPEKIVEDLNLKAFMQYLENIKLSDYKIDALILACTHFPYIKSALKSISSLLIIDPSEDMIKRCFK